MTDSLRRATYSPLIREALDFSNALHDRNGEVVAEALGIPLLLGAMSPTVRVVLEAFAVEELRPGDVIVSNDPYLGGGTHLNDINVIRPIFLDGELVLFAQSKAHMLDIGGREPGSWSPDAVNVFQEGVRLPPVKLVAGGVWNESLLRLLLTNVRFPGQLEADVQAQIGAVRVGEQQALKTFRQFGRDQVESAMAAILDHAESLMRDQITALPDGSYRAVDHVDSDGVSDEPVRIEVTVVVEGSELKVDFTGTAAQTVGSNGNMIFAGTESAVRLALRCLLAPGLPANEGCYRPIRVSAPSGSCVNPTSPAAVSVGLASVAHTVIEAVFKALARVLPERVIADQYGNVQPLILSGTNLHSKEPYLHFSSYPGGGGARSANDGLSGVITLTDGDVRNIPAEVVETRFPLRVERLQLIEDSGGPGRMRGGLGVRIDYRILGHDAHGVTTLNRYRIPPQGIGGGGEGRASRTVVEEDGQAREFWFGSFEAPAGALVSHQTGGGGGFGPALERDPALVQADVIGGYVSREAARSLYGVVFHPNLEIDSKHTEAERAARRKAGALALTNSAA
jgi:N-methylhydantoinase B